MVCDNHGKKIFRALEREELRKQGLCQICIWNEIEVKDYGNLNGARRSLCRACRARDKEHKRRDYARKQKT